MSFNGPALSFDDEGSILFDGENIIVTVPVGHEALDHLGAEEDIPFPVVYTHPSHAQNQQTSTEQSTGQASSSDSGKQSETGSDKFEKTSTPQQQSLNQPSASDFPPDIASKPDISEKEVFEVCGQFCQQNPQAMAAG